MANPRNIALIGNPNAGKTTLFNLLTGLNQRTGNFPGVTVEKKVGFMSLPTGFQVKITDLPGTYSLYPKSPDERVVFEALTQPKDSLDYIEAAIVVADCSNLLRNLLLFTQVADLGLPMVLVLNMVDLAEKKGIQVDLSMLQRNLGVQVVAMNSRTGEGLEQLKQVVAFGLKARDLPFFDARSLAGPLIDKMKSQFDLANDYQAFQLAHQFEHVSQLGERQKQMLQSIRSRYDFNGLSFQAAETMQRYSVIKGLIADAIVRRSPKSPLWTTQIDRWLMHKVWGYAIFLIIMLLMFQAVFTWAGLPQEWIELGMAWLGNTLRTTIGEGPLADLMVDGVVSGLSGILVFIPQIAILTGLIAFLDESGYMPRVVVIMDKLMRRFGLNGRSVVPLITGTACAVPAIMSTRGIENRKERLITVFVTPFMSCSARLPVYTALIALMVPSMNVLGVFNLQGLVLFALYIIGFVAAIGTAYVMNLILAKDERSYLMMELPLFQWPKWRNIATEMYLKTQAFVFEAGKVILAISILLWAVASYGPGNSLEEASQQAQQLANVQKLDASQTQALIASYKLQASYAGIVGKWIEPAIAPMGFDWKIGIALITSFAAREVFVGTMSTIYSINQDTEDVATLTERLRGEVNITTGQAIFTPALALSLILFYLFAMQCMSTLATTYRETKSWQYPLAQLVYMTGLAYLVSWLVFSLLS